MATGALGINIDPVGSQSMAPVIQVYMGPAAAQHLDTNMAADGSPDPGHLCGGHLLVATGAIDISTDSGYGRTKDPDTVLGKGLDPDVILALV